MSCTLAVPLRKTPSRDVRHLCGIQSLFASDESHLACRVLAGQLEVSFMWVSRLRVCCSAACGKARSKQRGCSGVRWGLHTAAWLLLPLLHGSPGFYCWCSHELTSRYLMLCFQQQQALRYLSRAPHLVLGHGENRSEMVKAPKDSAPGREEYGKLFFIVGE